MSESIADTELSRKFRKQLRRGLIYSVFIVFFLIPLWGMLSLMLFLNAHFSKFVFIVVTFLGWIFLITKFSKIYKESIRCPKCGNPYNMVNGWGLRIPFVGKCQTCGLPIKTEAKAEIR
jgi:hypothetical protein